MFSNDFPDILYDLRRGSPSILARRAELQQRVDELSKSCDVIAALDSEAEKLHMKAKEDTKAE